MEKEGVNKGEIRGLISALHFADENEVALSLYRDDAGVNIVMVDFELDVSYHWIIDPSTHNVRFFSINDSLEMGEGGLDR